MTMHLTTGLMALALSVPVVANAACNSTGRSQRPIPQQPIAFVDASSAATIPRVLIVPKYTTTTGVSTGSGHGPGLVTDSRALAAPFIYRPGEPFTPRQPDSRGLLVPAVVLFAGHGVRLNGIVAVAPGYEATWVFGLWDRPQQMRVPLHRLPDEESRQHLQRLRTLLGESTIRGRELTRSELQLFDSIADFDIDVAFDERERRLVSEFLSTQ
jgi:hypothetical protein